MIVNDQVRELVSAIETAQNTDSSAQIIELINLLHVNCQNPSVKQRYIEYNSKQFSLGVYPMDADGYAVAYDPLTQEAQIWQAWSNYGVVVSKQAVSQELAQGAIARMGEIVKQVSNANFDIDAPATYTHMPKDSNNVPFMSRGFVEIYHDDILAQLRQSLRVYLHYVIIWGRVDLWTTFDRMGVKLPEHPDSAGLPLHVDQNPLVDPHHHTRVQGVLALVDCKERGTLVVVPGSQCLFPEYGQVVVKNNPGYQGAYVELDLTQTFASTLANGKQVIPIRAGSLVSWSSGITHANTKNIANDARKVAYIAMCPANEFDQNSLAARDEAYMSGVSKYDHKAGLHVTKKPRYIAPNNFRKPEQLTFLGDLLYSRKPYFSVLRNKSNKRLLLNAELFGYGPSSVIADLYPKLREHFSYIAFIGSKFTYELQASDYDAVYILEDNQHDEHYIKNVMSHYDLLLTCSDFKMAEYARDINLPVAVYDQLAWFWPNVPQVLSKADVLYIAQDFFSVKERIKQNKDLFALTNIVAPIVKRKYNTVETAQQNVLLNFGGLKNPFWSNEEMLNFATLIYDTVRTVLPCDCNLIVAANPIIAEQVNGKYYTRQQMMDLLPTISLAIITPGLGNIFESAAHNIPTIFLPPANDSQARQAQLIHANGCADYCLDWKNLGLTIAYACEQSQVMRDIAAATHKALISAQLRVSLNEYFAHAYNTVKLAAGSNLIKLFDKFGMDGSNQIVQALKSFAEAHRPCLANAARPTIVFNIGGALQLRLESNMLQLSQENIRQLQAHIPGLTLDSSAESNKPIINLTHIQSNHDSEQLIEVSRNDIHLLAHYSAKMPQDILHLLYGMARRAWLEQQLCPVHAACVEMPDGRFVLIVGNSGTGKSSSALKLVLDSGAKLFSGDKTLVKFVGSEIYAVAGTKIMTLRQKDRHKWPQIRDNQGEYVADRFVFELSPEQSSTVESAKISAIFILQPHASMSQLPSDSARHTLFPYFLDTARANVMVGDKLLDGNISYAAIDGIRAGLAKAVPQIPVYQLSISAGDILDNMHRALNTAASSSAAKITSSATPGGTKKFLFGVCGLGSGHTYRQLPVMDALLAAGHEVAIFAYGMALDKFNTYYAGNSAVKIFEVANEFLIGDDNGLDYAASAVAPQNTQNFASINFRAMSLYNDVPDCVISDYEKVSAQVAYRYNVPLITLDQQSKFLLTGYPPDEIQRLRTFFPTAAKRIALSFFNINSSVDSSEPVTLLPPVLRPEILSLKGAPQSARKTILVYSSAMYPLDTLRLKELVKNINDVDFIFFPNNTHNYLEVLGSCHGIIATAGHSLLSEAMHLQKPVLAIPARIFEQQLNAKVISENGFGMQCENEKLSVNVVSDFLRDLNQFKQNIQLDRKKTLLGGNDPTPILEEIFACLPAATPNKRVKPTL